MFTNCVFCGSTDMSREDAMPTWMVRKFLAPGGKWINGARLSITGTRTQWPDRYRHRQATGKDVRVPVVCQRCNNGWMNELEKAAAPYLSAMMGGVALRLTPEIKRIVSVWAAKTAMMLMYFLTPPEPPHADYLEALYREKVLAPSDLGVWLAHYGGETPGQFTIKTAAGGWKLPTHTAHCVSLNLGACVVQVWLWDDPSHPPRVPPFEDKYPDHVIPIWPGTPDIQPDAQEWPQAKPFGDISLWRYFGRNERDIQRSIALLTQGDSLPPADR